MMVRLFWLAVASYLLLRSFLFYTQYQGSSSESLRARVEKFFTSEEIGKGFQYARRGFGARVAEAVLEIAVLLCLLQAGFPAWLSRMTGSWSGGRWPIQTALFTCILLGGLFLLQLPFQYYLEHVLERRFGFSNQTAGGWLLLQAKNLLVALALSSALTLILYGLLRAFPRGGWVAAIPLGVTLFQAAVAFLVPALLIPLYYSPSRLSASPFRERVAEVLRKGGIRAEEIFVIDETRYSSHTNAFFAGLGPQKSIYLYDTLLKDHGEDESLAVVAHEAGHWRGRHVLKGLALQGVGLLLGCLALHWLYPQVGPRLGWPPLRDPGSLVALLLLATLAGFFASPLQAGVSRIFEREADRAAVELTGNREACREAERRLARTNRSQLLPHPLVVFWFYSHPPAIERIEAVGE
jgi:STE24 endopeptidase